jgi:hypothetical protein
MHGNGDLQQLPFRISCHQHDVKTLPQNAYSC